MLYFNSIFDIDNNFNVFRPEFDKIFLLKIIGYYVILLYILITRCLFLSSFSKIFFQN